MAKLPDMSDSKVSKLDLSDALSGAKSLLGWKLIHDSPEGLTAGFIVETESYDMLDAASHAYGGERVRNSSLFRAAGTIYVYFTYGMHYCFNIATGQEGQGQGVLIRALEPCEGIELMRFRRRTDDITKLTNGPAKLVQAMGISKTHNGSSVFDGSIRLESGIFPGSIVQTTRVGITKAMELPWRFYIKESPYVSRK